MKTIKTQVVLPEALVKELKETVPGRQRSSFISSATRKELDRLRFHHIVGQSDPIWSDRNHPKLKSPQSIQKYLKGTRKGWQKRWGNLQG